MIEPTSEQLNVPELDSVERRAQLLVEQVVEAPSIPAMAASFDVEFPTDYSELPTDKKLEWLTGFSNVHLNFRKSKERNQVKEVTLTHEQDTAVRAFVEQFQMDKETYAQHGAYDAATVLGGLADEVDEQGVYKMGACRARVRKLKGTLESGVQVPMVVLLGGGRRLGAKERAANPGAKTEFDALAMAFEQELGVSKDTAEIVDYHDIQRRPHEPEAWRIRYYDMQDGTQAFAVGSPATPGRHRANTRGANQFMRALSDADLFPLGRLLVVTTDLYVPFQDLDARRNLGLELGVDIDTIGFSGVDRPTYKYADEINATFNKARQLHTALTERRQRRIAAPAIGGELELSSNGAV